MNMESTPTEGKVTCKEVMHHICENLKEDLDSEKCRNN